VATTWVAVFDVMAPAVDPKLTLVAPDRLLPVIVTDVLPAAGPLVGLTPLTVGTLALTMAALMFDVVRPALTCTAFRAPALLALVTAPAMLPPVAADAADAPMVRPVNTTSWMATA
jgi:hypothetical protein